jgi:hypothetical protein
MAVLCDAAAPTVRAPPQTPKGERTVGQSYQPHKSSGAKSSFMR